MKRRQLIKTAAFSSIYLSAGCFGENKTDTSTLLIDTSNTDSTATPNLLFIPPLLDPSPDQNGVKQFDLTIQSATHSFFDGIETESYGINGSYLGPTLRVELGDKVSINYTNQLNEVTTMHGHGMHVPANMDGGPHQIIEVGATWSAQYTVKQKACTNWYHPHQMGKTAEQIYKGLAGVIILEDAETLTHPLPKTYGVDDIPLVLQDRFFDENGQFDYSPTHMEIMRGYKGDIFIANGQIEPIFAATTTLLRIRLLNASNAGVYNLSFTDNHPFKQCAGDNSLLERPVEMSSLLLTPGERAEIIVDLSSFVGETITLTETTENKAFLHIQVSASLTNSTSIPTELTILNRWSETDAVQTRHFTLSGSQGQLYINNKQMDITRIDQRLILNQIELWEIENQMQMDHNFHIHASHFLVLSRNGNPAEVQDNCKGYKDTVHVPPSETVRIIVKMSDYEDPDGKYMFHCHFLEHEDAGMIGQFIVEGN
tara:strand:+ start:208 stop:1659 length:1452 start_codon:yes stop_codon:yes gene_type:complete